MGVGLEGMGARLAEAAGRVAQGLEGGQQPLAFARKVDMAANTVRGG